MQRLVDAYNASGPAQRVVLSERDWSQGKLPAMLLLGDAEQERFLTGKPRYRSLYRVMAGAGLALKTFKPQAFVTLRQSIPAGACWRCRWRWPRR